MTQLTELAVKAKTDKKALEDLCNLPDFEKLVYRAYSNALNRMTYYDKTIESEDILQETKEKIISNIKYFRAESEFATWLYRIAYNITIDKITKLIREKHSRSGLIDRIKDIKRKNISRKIFVKAIEKLSDLEKEVIYSHDYDEKTFQEISDAIKIPRSSIYDVYKRALRNLTNIITKDNEFLELYNEEEKNDQEN